MVRIAVVGASGRMGREIIKAILKKKHCQLTVATCKKTSPFHGADVGALLSGSRTIGVTMTHCLEQQLDHVDVIVDFTHPSTTEMLVHLCRQFHKKIVIGTSGLSATQKKLITECAQYTSIVLAPNTSLAVNVAFQLVQLATQNIGHQSDIDIIEKHHRNKLDAPSGTALTFGALISDIRKRSLDDCAVYGRSGVANQARAQETIGFSSIRAGHHVGEHSVMFAMDGEEIDITVRSLHRSSYAEGAVLAAHWLMKQPNGLYNMKDVLGLRNVLEATK